MRDILLLLLAMALQSGGEDTRAPEGAVASVADTALVAEDQTPTGRFTTATEVRPILQATRMAWIATRDWDGQDLLYVTHLWAWRCGLVRIEVGVNGAPPDIWPMPPCHLDQDAPNAILDGDGLPYRAFPAGSLDRIEVVVTYDDLSTERAVFDGSGGLLD